jgi:transcriptional regulator with XRE-family HTH domain
MHKVSYKIDKLRSARNWSVYKLAQESGISPNTIHQWLHTDTVPTIPALQEICKGFGITLGEFFTDADLVKITPELKALIDNWRTLTPENKKIITDLMKRLK